MNVSSIVVKTMPEHHGEVLAALEAADFCDVHFNDGRGKTVVTVEGENIEVEMSKMKLIQAIPNVLMAEMIYAYSEDELVKAREFFEAKSDAVPDSLKEE